MTALLASKTRVTAAVANNRHSWLAAWSALIAITLPLPATLSWAAGDIRPGVWFTIGAAFLAAFFSGRATIRSSNRDRFAHLVDAGLFLIVSIISTVFLALITTPEQGKLYRLNFAGYVGVDETVPSYLLLLWAACLSAFPLRTRRRIETTSTAYTFDGRTAAILATFGGIGLGLTLTVSRMQAFSERGEVGGNGLVSLLYWAAAVFVTYAILYWRASDNRVWLIISLTAIAGIALTGNRSPLALLAVAAVIRIVQMKRGRLLAAVGLAAPIGLGAFSYQSIWRSRVAAQLPADPASVLSQIAADPTRELLRVGIDSIEGMTLSRILLERGFDARWLDPLTAVLNFVPRQVWPDKPTLLGSEIGERYLGLGAGGLFMSGLGYFALVTGSVALGFIVFLIVMRLLKRFVATERFSLVAVTAGIFLTFRLTLAGDAFDIFLAIQMVLIFSVAKTIGRLLPWTK